MRTVLVTGASGFIGKNLCSALEQKRNLKLLPYGREDNVETLAVYLEQADFIFHLAGVNRPQSPEEYDEGNRGFTDILLSLIEQQGKRTPIAFASSIQAALDNAYGASKRAAEAALFEWSRKNHAPVYIYRLPNVFGKWSKPNYNSVIATFCHNISHGIPIEIHHPLNELTLVYIDDVIHEFLQTVNELTSPDEDGFCYVSKRYQVTLQQIVNLLYSFDQSRKHLVMPDLKGDFERKLFATYTSYLPEDEFDYSLDMKEDARGWLAEFIKSKEFGQIFISRTKPGITRGNHWHHTKVEKFLVVDGEGLIRLKKVGSNDLITYNVSGRQLKVVDIPAGYTHSITNTGSRDMITLFWANQVFDPEQPDTYYLEV
ncbi:SDR family oxidoreductase [Heliobacterium chlorum]|uniref:SDR family oxidoreductase n=1 Tax=Heliobacterium chlorum TaxID=2698 RepID=A0ABR7T4X7_HELCL|nr:SDR family oxidoreductase [Heliobacterium chlorum]